MLFLPKYGINDVCAMAAAEWPTAMANARANSASEGTGERIGSTSEWDGPDENRCDLTVTPGPLQMIRRAKSLGITPACPRVEPPPDRFGRQRYTADGRDIRRKSGINEHAPGFTSTGRRVRSRGAGVCR